MGTGWKCEHRSRELRLWESDKGCTKWPQHSLSTMSKQLLGYRQLSRMGVSDLVHCHLKHLGFHGTVVMSEELIRGDRFISPSAALTMVLSTRDPPRLVFKLSDFRSYDIAQFVIHPSPDPLILSFYVYIIPMATIPPPLGAKQPANGWTRKDRPCDACVRLVVSIL